MPRPSRAVVAGVVEDTDTVADTVDIAVDAEADTVDIAVAGTVDTAVMEDPVDTLGGERTSIPSVRNYHIDLN